MPALWKSPKLILVVAVLCLVGALWAAAQDSAPLPITRQTESEMEKAFMQVLSGKKVRRQQRDDTYPEQEEKLGKKISAYLKPGSIADVFIPVSAHAISDTDINRIIRHAKIVKYEDLKPLALKPCEIIRVTDKKERAFDLCIFSAPDHRGTITFPNYQRFWFAVTDEHRK